MLLLFADQHFFFLEAKLNIKLNLTQRLSNDHRVRRGMDQMTSMASTLQQLHAFCRNKVSSRHFRSVTFIDDFLAISPLKSFFIQRQNAFITQVYNFLVIITVFSFLSEFLPRRPGLELGDSDNITSFLQILFHFYFFLISFQEV